MQTDLDRHPSRLMARTVIDLDEDMVTKAMRIFGAKTKAKAVRLVLGEAVKRHLRQEGEAERQGGTQAAPRALPPRRVPAHVTQLEAELQRRIEADMEPMPGVRFLASERLAVRFTVSLPGGHGGAAW